MESELKMDPDPADCPACGEACRWLDDGDLIECQGVDSEDERRCGYIFVDAYGSKRKTLEAHNALARRAEIGRLVEEIVANVEQFAFDVCRALNDESETGETLVTRMLDRAMEKAIDDGSLSVQEIGGGDE